MGALWLFMKMIPTGLPAAFLALYARVCGWETSIGISFLFSYLFAGGIYGYCMAYLGPEITCWVCVYGMARCTYGPPK